MRCALKSCGPAAAEAVFDGLSLCEVHLFKAKRLSKGECCPSASSMLWSILGGDEVNDIIEELKADGN